MRGINTWRMPISSAPREAASFLSPRTLHGDAVMCAMSDKMGRAAACLRLHGDVRVRAEESITRTALTAVQQRECRHVQRGAQGERVRGRALISEDGVESGVMPRRKAATFHATFPPT